MEVIELDMLVQRKEIDSATSMAEAVHQVLVGWLRPEVAAVVQVASASLPIPEREKKLVARAVAQRQAEFIAGRWCAHRALEKIGLPAEEILIGPLGGPLWPQEANGSVVHESGICAALAARKSLVPFVGLDLMDTSRKVEIDELAPLFRTPKDAISPLSAPNERLRTMICFCVKEAVIKAASPYLDRFLDFKEIEVEVGPDTFRARLDAVPETFSGRWGIVGPFILAVLPGQEKAEGI